MNGASNRGSLGNVSKKATDPAANAVDANTNSMIATRTDVVLLWAIQKPLSHISHKVVPVMDDGSWHCLQCVSEVGYMISAKAATAARRHDRIRNEDSA